MDVVGELLEGIEQGSEIRGRGNQLRGPFQKTKLEYQSLR